MKERQKDWKLDGIEVKYLENWHRGRIERTVCIDPRWCPW